MKLSKQTKQWIWYILLVVIIVSFVGFYGFDRGGSSNSYVVVKVNGKPIYLDDYKNVYEQYQTAYKLNQADGASADQLRQYVERRSLDDLVQKQLVLQSASKNGIKPSAEEILGMVARDKRFQDDKGQFNPGIWANAPMYLKKRIEKEFADSLSSQYFEFRIYNAVKISDAEIRNQFDMNNTKVKVAYVYDQDQAAEGGQNLLVPLAGAGNKVDKVAELMKQGLSFQVAAASAGVAIQTTDFFSFANRVFMEGSTNKTAEPLEAVIDTYKHAFAMKPGSVSPVINTRGGKVILAVLARKEADWQNLAKQVPQLRAEVQQAHMRDYINQWMTSTYSASKIDDSGFRRLFSREK